MSGVAREIAARRGMGRGAKGRPGVEPGVQPRVQPRVTETGGVDVRSRAEDSGHPTAPAHWPRGVAWRGRSGSRLARCITGIPSCRPGPSALSGPTRSRTGAGGSALCGTPRAVRSADAFLRNSSDSPPPADQRAQRRSRLRLRPPVRAGNQAPVTQVEFRFLRNSSDPPADCPALPSMPLAASAPVRAGSLALTPWPPQARTGYQPGRVQRRRRSS